MTSLRFEWDEAKNRANQRKHGLSFERARQAFDDPFLLSIHNRFEDVQAGHFQFATAALDLGGHVRVHNRIKHDTGCRCDLL